jgi:AAA domain
MQDGSARGPNGRIDHGTRGGSRRTERLPGGQGRYQPEGAAELLARRLDPPCIIVDGMLSDGLTVLGGGPKDGKSWLAEDLALAVAAGRPWQARQTHAGGVLYIDLENGERIIQERLRQLLDGREQPLERLRFVYEWPCFDEGSGSGLTLLEEYLQAERDIGLVIVDMLAGVRPPRTRADSAGVYEGDYAFASRLNQFALAHHIALLGLHHTNKKDVKPENPMRAISGSHGLTGGSSANWLLNRPFGASQAQLYIASRELETSDIVLLRDDLTGAWETTEQVPTEAAVSAERACMLAAFVSRGDVLSYRDLHEATGFEGPRLRNLTSRMVQAGQLIREDLGAFRLSEHSSRPVSPAPADTPRSLSGDGTNPQFMGIHDIQQPERITEAPRGVTDTPRSLSDDQRTALRALIGRRVAERGYPPVSLGPGRSVAGLEAAWRIFVRSASDEDLLTAARALGCDVRAAGIANEEGSAS